MDEDEDGDRDGDIGSGIITDSLAGLIDVKKIQVTAPGKPTSEQKLKAFFNDPEKSFKIFMSSYSRSMGYIWYRILLFDLQEKKRELIKYSFSGRLLISTAFLAYFTTLSTFYYEARFFLRSNTSYVVHWKSLHLR